ncbi:peptide-methionine (S)-S-oxide reductase MsrA [Pseudoclavibacter sp. CFCC 13796]|uniref:peptide-methionine (S)-S-oxide reductase MsrA n=1 Tax=Pseudoclavibacter sp. CFCC 13796 TaxID=2615179 RepID=UPI00130131EE|nr:peptide-methionine (S)-S-oxide reductase MsrA [Pseudoclavibacter sp. CFCC 13796]KAB1661353.1 peptide-methionine (S)-S-oxide reductase MsrA [Pseudoclavibacter sp. CFCC 13796]
MDEIVVAGGCFWCLDSVFRHLRGVEEVISGYVGGSVEHPTYEQVCTGTTGHAEAVKVVFDEQQLPVDTLLDVFFTLHDPTTLNRQGNDVGTQYRSAMFPTDAAQRETFERAIQRAQEWWDAPIVTTIEPLGAFWPAEDYHQDFFAKNPGQGYCQAVIPAKVAKVRRRFADLFVD